MKISISKSALAGAALAVVSSLPATVLARDTISIVGSSTVYPFTTVVAERFGRGGKFQTPKVESTGTGGGAKLFCQGVGLQHPDFTNASRRMKKSEFELCQQNGVKEVVELLVGYDGLAVANSVDGPSMDITLRELYLALAKEVPNPNGKEELVANPYTTWKQINPALPNVKIEVVGPPPTSGTRDSFNELGIEGGCKTYPWLAAMKDADKNAYKAKCRTIREDGYYIEAGENDNLIVQKLKSNPNAVGAFGYSFLEENHNVVKAVKIGGVEPTMDTVSSGEYPMSRSMFIYAKKQHIGVVPGMEEFLKEYGSMRALGPDGYLVEKGLIPAPEAQLKESFKKVKNLEVLTGNEL